MREYHLDVHHNPQPGIVPMEQKFLLCFQFMIKSTVAASEHLNYLDTNILLSELGLKNLLFLQ